MKTTYAQIKAGEAPTNTNTSLLEEANKELRKITEKVVRAPETAIMKQRRASKIRPRKEK